jgi:hypothetical protein
MPEEITCKGEAEKRVGTILLGSQKDHSYPLLIFPFFTPWQYHSDNLETRKLILSIQHHVP